MAIRFQCPSCQLVRAVNERLLGRHIKCPGCENMVRLPSPEEIERARVDQAAARRKQAAQGPTTVVVQPTVLSSPATAALSPEERWEAEERALAAAQTSFKKVARKEENDMDMTPMVDVTFLLLIFFMITASFSVQKAFKTPAQTRDDPSMNPIQQPEEDNPDIVTVQIDEFNAFNVITTDWDRPAGSKQDLIVLLNQARQGDSSGNQPTRVVVQAHEDSIHAALVDALDAGREVGFESFEVTTVEQFD
ncbi:MAG: biopolymer transporter ExbD [Pirellulaceae bacterium]|nr:MAG: biopolymer transporter ExbD [Pirellulaceae bacterium]